MITKDGRDTPIGKLTPENYIVPKGEERSYHVVIEVETYDPKTGVKLSKPRLQKFGKKIFEALVRESLRKQGYKVTILHNPNDWIKAKAAEAAEKAKEAAEEKAKQEQEKFDAAVAAAVAKALAEKEAAAEKANADPKADPAPETASAPEAPAEAPSEESAKASDGASGEAETAESTPKRPGRPAKDSK